MAGPEDRVRYSVFGVVTLYIATALLGMIMFSGWLFLAPNVPPALRSLRAAPLFVVTFCLLIAIALSLLKRWHQLWYGVAEVAVASVGAWRSIGTAATDQTTRLLLIAGVVYVMSRGVNNILDALAKRRSAVDADRGIDRTKASV